MEPRQINRGTTYEDDQPTFSYDRFLEIEVALAAIYRLKNPDTEKLVRNTVKYVNEIERICAFKRVRLLIVLIPDELQIDGALQRAVIEKLKVPPLNNTSRLLEPGSIAQRGHLQLFDNCALQSAIDLQLIRDENDKKTGSLKGADSLDFIHVFHGITNQLFGVGVLQAVNGRPCYLDLEEPVIGKRGLVVLIRSPRIDLTGFQSSGTFQRSLTRETT